MKPPRPALSGRAHRGFERFRKDLTALMKDELPGTATPEDQILAGMLFNVGQLREERLDVADLRLLHTAFKELRYALKVFKPYRAVPKAAVFGSARTAPGHPNYKMAAAFGRKLARKGWMIITGGASGIMEAAMVGAGVQNSFGLNILLPFEQDANPIIRGNPKLVYFKYFFTRKLMFLKESDATVLFPGGYGTFDEGFESLTLVQTGKAKPRPIALLDVPRSAYWKSFLGTLRRNMEKTHLVSRGDVDLMRHFHDVDAAVEELTGFFSNYHSSRFLGDRYLIRLKRPVTAALVDRLNRSFGDLLTGGRFERLTEPGEDDNRDPYLHRIVFHFNRTSYSRLRELIDTLNTL